MKRLLLAASLMLGACGPNGVDANTGARHPCEQLRECLCDAERLNGGDAAACNTAVDTMKANNPDQCATDLDNACGNPNTSIDLDRAGI